MAESIPTEMQVARDGLIHQGTEMGTNPGLSEYAQRRERNVEKIKRKLEALFPPGSSLVYGGWKCAMQFPASYFLY